MTHVIGYLCIDCGAPLVWCELCQRYVHAARIGRHMDERDCGASEVGIDCALGAIAPALHPGNSSDVVFSCLAIQAIVWLIFYLIVGAWDASYRAGWLP